MKKIWSNIKHWLALAYGLGMIVLVIIFFFNYSGRWMLLISEMIPIAGK